MFLCFHFEGIRQYSYIANNNSVINSLRFTYIDRELSISEGVFASLNSNESSSQSLGNVSTCIKHILDDSLDLIVRALCVKNLIKRCIRVLLLGGGVKRSGRSSVFSEQLGGGGCRTSNRRRERSSAGDGEECENEFHVERLYETKEDAIFSLTEAEDTRTGNDNNAMLSRSVFPNTYYAYLHILLREMREMGDVSADIEPMKTRTATSLNERPFS